MEVLFHFVFELVKISILGCIYATLILVTFKIIGRYKPDSWFDRVSKKKLRLWFLSGLFISIGLLFFMFSYWGNHGLGDGPRIPIGHGVVVDNTNWAEYGYLEEIKTSENFNIEMTQFKVVNDKLIGNLESDFYEYKNSYFIYDMDIKQIIEFYTKKDYEDFASKNNLPLANELMSFEQNYREHWNGWRFWLLP